MNTSDTTRTKDEGVPEWFQFKLERDRAITEAARLRGELDHANMLLRYCDEARMAEYRLRTQGHE